MNARRTSAAAPGLAVLALCAVLALSAMPSQASQIPSVRLLDPALHELSIAYGYGAVALIEVYDPQASGGQATVTVKARSEADTSGETVVLHRARDGRFRGTLGFEEVSNPLNGEVAVADGGKVTVQTAAGRDSEASLIWRTASVGTLTVAEPVVHGLNATVLISVRDPDMARDSPSSSKVAVDLVQDGRFFQRLCLPQIAGQPGLFQLAYRPFVETTYPAGGCQAFPRPPVLTPGPARSLELTYRDDRTPHGLVTIQQAAVILQPTTTATVQLLRTDGYTLLGPGSFVRGVGTDRLLVRVLDLDQDGQESVPVTALSNSQPSGQVIDLRAVGKGEFIGRLGFAPSASVAGAALAVAHSDLVAVRYIDDHDVTGKRTDATATTQWFEAPTVRIQPLAESAGRFAEGTVVQIVDPLAGSTAGQDTVHARLASDRDPVGFRVSLEEDMAKPGLFAAQVWTNRTASDAAAPAIWAMPGDRVVASYLGNPSDPSQPALESVARVPGTAGPARPAPSLRLYATERFENRVSAAWGTGTIYFEVVDPGLDADATVRDSVTVRLQSPLETVDSGAPTSWNGGEPLELVETGWNSGTFRASIALTCAPPPSVGQLSVPCEGRSAGSLTLQYKDESHFGAPGIIKLAVPWNSADRPVPGQTLGFIGPDGRLARDELAGDGPLRFRILDNDHAADPSRGLDSVPVHVSSTTEPSGIVVTLKELTGRQGAAGPESGMEGSLAVCEQDVCEGPSLHVRDGDVVRMAYRDGSSVGEEDIIASITWRQTSNASLGLALKEPIPLEPATLTVVDADANRDPLARETVRANATSDALAAPWAIELLETQTDSGTFTGMLPFSLGSADDGLPVGEGARIVVSYLEPHDVTGHPAVRSTEVRWHERPAALAFVGAADGLESTVGVVLLAEAEDQTRGIDLVEVMAWSASDGAGERLTLTETGPSTGRFEGTLGFEDKVVAGNQRLFVRNGDGIMVHHWDAPTEAFPIARSRVAQALWESDAQHSMGLVADRTSGPAPLNVTFRLEVAPPEMRNATLHFGDGASMVVDLPAEVPHVFSVAGTYEVWLRANGEGGPSDVRLLIQATSPLMAEPSDPLSGSAIEAANHQVALDVRAGAGHDELTWSLPALPPAPIQAVQAWHWSGDRYRLIQTLEPGEANFDQGPLVHVRAARTEPRYLVTVAFGSSEDTGFYAAGSTPDPAVYPGTSAPARRDRDAPIAGIASLAGLLLAAASLRRDRRP